MGKFADILSARRTDILRIWTASIRPLSDETAQVSIFELLDHLPKILDELTDALRSSEDGPVNVDRTTSSRHGVQRFRLGFNIEAVVHEYGLLHRCLLDIIREEDLTLGFEERRMMNEFIFVSIADAVAQYSRQRDAELQRQTNEHFAFLAHELRNPLASLQLALGSRQGRELVQSTPLGNLLARGVERMEALIEGALALALSGTGVEPHKTRLRVSSLVTDAIAESVLAAGDKEILIEAQGDENVEIDADERLMRSAITNLLGNAVKFSRRGGRVHVRFGQQNDKVIIEVEDSCGGLPPGAAEKMFMPFVQVGQDRSGYGLGLAIARQALEAHQGSLGVRDRPGEGCTMTIELPLAQRSVERDRGA